MIIKQLKTIPLKGYKDTEVIYGEIYLLDNNILELASVRLIEIMAEWRKDLR